MKSRLLVLLAGLLLLGLAAPARQAQAAVSVGVSVVSGGPHRGLSLSFSSRPNFGLIPGSRVYYGRDIDRDIYCYGDEWYYVDEDTWYEGPSYQGPFVQVSFSSVPYAVRGVPVRYRRHWSGYSNGGYSSYGNYRDRSGYGNNRGGYSDRNPTWNQNNQNRGSWNGRTGSQSGTWNDRNGSQDRGSYQDRQNQNGDRQNNGNGRARGHDRGKHRGHARDNGNQ